MKAKSISREYQNAWRKLPHAVRRKRLAQRLRRLWLRLLADEQRNRSIGWWLR